jgi:hypothetical protein
MWEDFFPFFQLSSDLGVVGSVGRGKPRGIQSLFAEHRAFECYHDGYARGAHWEERVKLAVWWAGYLHDLKAS